MFYETLYQQNPKSEMAQEWCVSYGVLNDEDAARVYKLICNRKGKPMAEPVKAEKKGSAHAASQSSKSKVKSEEAAATKVIPFQHSLLLHFNLTSIFYKNPRRLQKRRRNLLRQRR